MSEISRESKQQRREFSSQKIKNEKGECITFRKGIADTFGEFYNRLYEDSEKDNSEHEMRDDKRIPEITSEELQSAISKLKTGTSPDGNGIRAEDIKDCNHETREKMRQIFNEIIKRNNFTPDEWKKVKIKVIYKKGDVEDVSNYRPICSLPAMYKLFSTILFGRFYPMLDQNQAEDQAGFRKILPDNGPSCNVQNDGTEMPRVGNQNVDCDGGPHEGVRLHLSQFFLGGTQILQRRTRIHQPPEENLQRSEGFDTDRRTECSTRYCSTHKKNEIQRWQKTKGMGIYLSDQERDCLTNLRFADDVMLFATSKEQTRNMMCEFKKATEKVGLRIHPHKTKILSNQSTINSDTKKHFEVDDINIEILTGNESVKYLGQSISFYTNKKRQKSRAGSEQHGRPSTNTDKS